MIAELGRGQRSLLCAASIVGVIRRQHSELSQSAQSRLNDNNRFRRLMAYDEYDETSRTPHSPPVWTPPTRWCGAGNSFGGKCQAAEGRSGRNSLERSAAFFVGTDCGWRSVLHSRSHPFVMDCQGIHPTLEGAILTIPSMSAMAILRQLTFG
jgi:hypothetical protein